MGQRFQIITNNRGSIKVYHSQWLWGDYAIRRIGTALRNFLNYSKDGYRDFEDYLKGSFYGKANDMNSFERYGHKADNYFNDNKWICGKFKTRDFKKFLKTLDNNDGFFYIEFGDKGFMGRGFGIKGYCFMLRNELKPITAEEYLKDYTRIEFDKKQLKEFQDGLKIFSRLNLIKPIKTIKWE